MPNVPAIAGWNSYNFDWRYMINRVKILFGQGEMYNLIRKASPTGDITYITYTDAAGVKKDSTIAIHFSAVANRLPNPLNFNFEEFNQIKETEIKKEEKKPIFFTDDDFNDIHMTPLVLKSNRDKSALAQNIGINIVPCIPVLLFHLYAWKYTPKSVKFLAHCQSCCL